MRQIAGTDLWLGHAGDARDPAGVFEAGIVPVVDLAGEEPPARLPRDLAYLRFPLLDGPGNPPWRRPGDGLAEMLRAGRADVAPGLWADLLEAAAGHVRLGDGP